jgi:hypothetical protein
MSKPQCATTHELATEALSESASRLLLDDSLHFGRLNFLRARVSGLRLHPSSPELAEQYLVAPGSLDTAIEGALLGRKGLPHLHQLLFEQTWTAVTVVVPPSGNERFKMFKQVVDAMLAPPFPLPTMKTHHTSSSTHIRNDYLTTVLPLPWAELLVDCSPEGALVALDTPKPVTFADLFDRIITEAEFALSLPSGFANLHAPQVCRLLPHLLASLLVPGRTDMPQPRFIAPQPRARRGGTAFAKEPVEFWGGAASIAVSPSALASLTSHMPASPKYDGIDPVSRVVDLMSATRIEPEGSISPHDWLIYQARWGYFFPGYWTGVLAGFEILARYGVVAHGIFMTNTPDSAYEVVLEQGEVHKRPILIGSEHRMLAEYLSEQRMWMSAYDMTPLAPNTQELQAVLRDLPAPERVLIQGPS